MKPILVSKIQKLLKQGIVAYDRSENASGHPQVCDTVEVYPDRVFYVPMFSVGQQNVHAIKYNRRETNGEALSFFLGSRLVGYITTFDDTPEIDTDRAKTHRAEWNEYLKNEKNRKAWDRFVDTQREAHINS